MSKIDSREKATKLLLKKAPVIKALKVLDYGDLFVFEVIPELIGLVAVDKSTGAVSGFNPLYNNPDKFFDEWDKRAIDVSDNSKWR